MTEDEGKKVYFEDVLDGCLEGGIDTEKAMVLFSGAGDPENARKLFSAASSVRNASLGRKLAVTAHIHMITRCAVDPPCLYCSLSSRDEPIREERQVLSDDELSRYAEFAVSRGVKSIVLVGGTDLAGSDTCVRRAVESIRRIADVDIALDVGPSFSRETAIWLKGKGVSTVYCSVETVNRAAFAEAKPGDSLQARMNFIGMLQNEGLKIGSVVMDGLGNERDLIDSILYHTSFSNLAYLYISTFHPVPGTPWSSRDAASLQKSLIALSIARLAFPGVHLGLAEVEVEDPGSVSRLESQLMAGGGNSVAGLLLYSKKTVDNTEQIRLRASRVGFETT